MHSLIPTGATVFAIALFSSKKWVQTVSTFSQRKKEQANKNSEISSRAVREDDSFQNKMVEFNIALLNQMTMSGTLNFSDLANIGSVDNHQQARMMDDSAATLYPWLTDLPTPEGQKIWDPAKKKSWDLQRNRQIRNRQISKNTFFWLFAV